MNGFEVSNRTEGGDGRICRDASSRRAYQEMLLEVGDAAVATDACIFLVGSHSRDPVNLVAAARVHEGRMAPSTPALLRSNASWGPRRLVPRRTPTLRPGTAFSRRSSGTCGGLKGARREIAPHTFHAARTRIRALWGTSQSALRLQKLANTVVQRLAEADSLGGRYLRQVRRSSRCTGFRGRIRACDAHYTVLSPPLRSS